MSDVSSARPLPRLVVLASGSGTNLQAIVDACQEGLIQAEVVAVGSNRGDAGALRRAANAAIPSFVVAPAVGEPRESYDDRLSTAICEYQPDWVVLAGWMRILTMSMLQHFPSRVVNLHPTLPGAFPGTHAIERAFAAAERGEITHTGVMVHLVPDQGVDDGPVLAMAEVAIDVEAGLDALRTRMHEVEHELLTSTIARLVTEVS